MQKYEIHAYERSSERPGEVHIIKKFAWISDFLCENKCYLLIPSFTFKNIWKTKRGKKIFPIHWFPLQIPTKAQLGHTEAASMAGCRNCTIWAMVCYVSRCALAGSWINSRRLYPRRSIWNVGIPSGSISSCTTMSAHFCELFKVPSYSHFLPHILCYMADILFIYLQVIIQSIVNIVLNNLLDQFICLHLAFL